MLKLILIFFALLYLLRMLVPWVLRFFVGRLFKKVEAQQNQHQQKQSKGKAKPEKTKTSSKNLGEYIDYEEID